jgi:glutamine synthetase
VASRNGLYATFMPKPLFGENGSGMHTHMSLFKGDENAFYSADDKYHLSDTARSFIAGVLRHAREMSIVLAQTVNSYKRLVPGYEAPVYVAWSRRNRSALIRVPHYHPGQEKATRAELRCPDPACNPYLAFAVMLQAGLDGIEKGYELEDPMEQNLFDLTYDERKRLGIKSLPGSLGEAIMAAEDSEFMLGALGEHVFNRLLDLKRREWDTYRTQVSPWELDEYLPIL